MKNEEYDYSALKRKLFKLIILIVLAALVIVILLRSILQGYFGDGVVQFLENVFYLAPADAHNVYQFVFRNNIYEFMIIAIIAFMLVFFWLAISWLTKYFDEINAGMDKLVEESGAEITLSPELNFIKSKLNKIRSILEKRKNSAQEAEQRKNDLVVYLAHDLKTPLTSVIGYLSLLDEAPDMPQAQKTKYIGITLEKAYRLEQLINEFFEITRFNLQAIILQAEKINLRFMLQQMADEFYPMLTPQNKQVVVNVPDGLTLWGDPDKLARVFNNILKNAIAYSYENTIIDVSAFRQEKNISITFTNQGKPIPLPRLEAIFEKFYRLDSSRPSNTGGAGLGLAIAKEIVTAHGGTITAESNQERTVFMIILPISPVEIRKS